MLVTDNIKEREKTSDIFSDMEIFKKVFSDTEFAVTKLNKDMSKEEFKNKDIRNLAKDFLEE